MDKRLQSLDVLRGLDMIILIAVSPVVRAVDSAWGLPEGFMRQWSHFWGGFTFYDIIMPLFIFMCGAAIPLAVIKLAAATLTEGVAYVAGKEYGIVASALLAAAFMHFVVRTKTILTSRRVRNPREISEPRQPGPALQH